MANRLADFLEGPGFDGALEKYVAIERWVEEGVERPELERAVRAFIATQRDRLLHDEHPLLERLPPGLVAALEQAIADYLPVAVERIGALLSDPEARARVRNGLKRFLDRAIRSLAMHERVMAKLVITENRIERVLASLEGDGLADVAEVFESAEFRGQVGRAVNDAVVRFLRRLIAALRAPETRRWAVARARDAIALARRALAGEGGRQRLADAAHAAVRALLARPIGRPADLLPPDAAQRLRLALTEPLWQWMQRQVPVVVSQLSVQEMVEQKVMRFSTDRMEELIRNVTQKELTLIVQLGYVLGALVGAAAFLANLFIARL